MGKARPAARRRRSWAVQSSWRINVGFAVDGEKLAPLINVTCFRDDEDERTELTRVTLVDIDDLPRDGDAVARPYRLHHLVVIAAADETAARQGQRPMMANIAVLIGRLIDDLVGLADEGRRRNDVAMHGALGKFRVRIDRVIVGEREREIAERGTAKLLGGRVGRLAAAPGLQIVG